MSNLKEITLQVAYIAFHYLKEIIEKGVLFIKVGVVI